MPPPLAPDKVTFDDGKPSTIEQQAKDVAAFLAWASEPKMEERKQFGLGALIYLLIFSGLPYASYSTIWKNAAQQGSSEARGAGRECASTGSAWWSRGGEKKKN